MIKWMESARLRLKGGLLAAGLCVAASASADPGYYVMKPYSAPGRLTIDTRFWTVRLDGQQATLWPEVGLRYGIDTRWSSELLASFIGDSLDEQKLSSLNWINTYLLTQGQYPFDLALHTQIIRNHGAGNALEWGALLQTEVGLTQLNLNVVFEHDWPSDAGTQLKYQWQAVHRLRPGLRAGLQGFGEVGQWDHWSENPSHRAGFVVQFDDLRNIQAQAAYLRGKIYGARGDMFSAQVELQF